MNDLAPVTKPAFASTTVWNSIAVIGAAATAAYSAWKTGDTAMFGAAIVGVIGGVNSIVGRFKAQGPLSGWMATAADVIQEADTLAPILVSNLAPPVPASAPLPESH